MEPLKEFAELFADKNEARSYASQLLVYKTCKLTIND